ncbi:hypothetical protein AC579_5596 [Pseudocercospora musae]|uniref:Uncharacterized protein n=1 Tax=Pseudocercospora musae TaxID=113226 RepID=A0A139IP03_9PEZI|nr:hypothetical protein AC579_5596 [Pseudocercospora musae]
MADTTSSPSPYKPGHFINLVYPGLDPNIKTLPGFRSWYFAQPRNMGNRYYPHPGLDADGNPLRALSANENAFFHILETNLSAPDGAPSKRHRDVTVEKFIETVEEAANWVGNTELRIDAINTNRTSRDFKIRRMTVQRITKFTSRKGQDAREEHGNYRSIVVQSPEQQRSSMDTTPYAALRARDRRHGLKDQEPRPSRTPIFHDAPDGLMTLLSQGYVNKSYFQDERYDAWETWERSCSDLDARELSSEKFLKVVRERLLVDIWLHMRDNVEKEPPESSPAHLRAATEEPQQAQSDKAEAQFFSLE